MIVLAPSDSQFSILNLLLPTFYPDRLRPLNRPKDHIRIGEKIHHLLQLVASLRVVFKRVKGCLITATPIFLNVWSMAMTRMRCSLSQISLHRVSPRPSFS